MFTVKNVNYTILKIPKLEIKLTGNPLTCDCGMSYFMKNHLRGFRKSLRENGDYRFFPRNMIGHINYKINRF